MDVHSVDNAAKQLAASAVRTAMDISPEIRWAWLMLMAEAHTRAAMHLRDVAAGLDPQTGNPMDQGNAT